MAMPLSNPMKEGEDSKGILRGEILEFLRRFESSEKREEDMKKLLSHWKEALLTHAHIVGGRTQKVVEIFLGVCEDYANFRGMLERVKKEAEELRIHLAL